MRYLGLTADELRQTLQATLEEESAQTFADDYARILPILTAAACRLAGISDVNEVARVTHNCRFLVTENDHKVAVTRLRDKGSLLIQSMSGEAEWPSGWELLIKVGIGYSYD